MLCFEKHGFVFFFFTNLLDVTTRVQAKLLLQIEINPSRNKDMIGYIVEFTTERRLPHRPASWLHGLLGARDEPWRVPFGLRPDPAGTFPYS